MALAERTRKGTQTMRRPSRSLAPRTARRVACLAALAVGAILAPLAEPAVANGHVVETVAPQWAPTGGGTAVRIGGTGFVNVTAVEFDGVAATDFEVIDDELITAIVPAGGPNNSFVDVTVTEGGTDSTLSGTFAYSNATLGVTPSTGLDAGDAITATVTGYFPNTTIIFPELNPLQIYLEHPDFADAEPPYVDTLLPFPTSTNGSGNKTFNTNLTDPFNPDGQMIDPNATCPVNQTTSNYLGTSAPASFTDPAYAGRCLIVVNQFGIASLDTPIGFGTDDEPVPAAPVFTTNKASANQGENVTITGGSNWNANPFFGSSRNATNPGETTTTVQICGLTGGGCSTRRGNGTVGMTRYVDTNPAQEEIDGVFSGATLSGNIVVGTDIPDNCTTCFIRVRQNRPAGGFIQATVPLTVT